MTEISSEIPQEQRTRRYCQWCGEAVESGSYCGGCGGPLESQPINGAAASPGGAPPHPPIPQFPPPAPPGTSAYPYPAAYPPPPPSGGRNTGLIVGLAAGIVAVLGVVAAIVLLAGGSSSSAPTISTVSNAAAVSPNSPNVPSAASPATGSGKSLHVPHSFRARAHHTAPAPTSTPTPAGTSSTSADSQAVRQVVQQHWADINQGNFTGAFALFVPGYQDRSSWIQSHQQESPISASVAVGTPTFSSSTSANLPLVSLRTNDPVDGCSTWTGSYDLQKINDSWLISQANLQKGAC